MAVLDPPPYLLSLQTNIRARPIPWDGAVRAGSISEWQLERVKAVDKVRRDVRVRTVEADVDGYVRLLVGADEGGGGDGSILDSARNRADIVQYVLVLAADLVQGVPALALALVASEERYRPVLPFVRQGKAEDPVPLLASALLTGLVSRSLAARRKPSPTDEQALPVLYGYLATLTASHDNGLQDVGVQAYSELLRTSRARKLFWEQRNETVGPLVAILQAAAGSGREARPAPGGTRSAAEAVVGGGVGLQLLYHVLLVVWQLSFEAGLVGEQLEENYGFVRLYALLLRVSPKEKTTRLVLATLANVLAAHRALLPVAVLERLPAQLAHLRSRHLADPDLVADLDGLTAALDDYARRQTTLDEYAAEVRSGHLRWTPPHGSDAFWRDNAARIADADGGALVAALARILARDWDDDKTVLAVACNDVGRLVRAAPGRRRQLEKLGVKARVMALMGDADAGVRWQALRAVGEWLRYWGGEEEKR